MNITIQQQRALALAILAFVLLLVYLAIINPVLSRYQNANEQIETLTFSLERYQQLDASRKQEESMLRQVKNSPLKSYLLEGETYSVVSARLQQQLKQMLSQTGGQIISTQSLPVKNRDNQDIPSVTLKVQIKAGIDELKELLFLIETSRPGLYVEDLSISSSRIRNSSYARKQVMQPLDIRFNLTGYVSGMDTL